MNANSPYKNIELQYLPSTKNWHGLKITSTPSLARSVQINKRQDKVRSSKFEN